MTQDIPSPQAGERMKSYLEKIAAGPKMSKDLTEAEAEDALSLILNSEVSGERAAVFLIAARMKLETLEENVGFWKALDATTFKQEVKFDKLLQISEAFDGFQRTPIFTFYTIPLLAEMGLPTYGHSAMPLPPKCGVTFEELLVNHYKAAQDHGSKTRIRLLEQFGFGYLSTQQSNPKLNVLKHLREEIVKRPMLATLEKMLMPLKAKTNFLATNYFHPGYERSMLAVAERAGWDKTVVGNGMEGSTLFGVHKPARLYVLAKAEAVQVQSFTFGDQLNPAAAESIQKGFEELKGTETTLRNLALLGEQALRGKDGPAAPLIAYQAATLGHLFGVLPNMQMGYETAHTLLQSGRVYSNLMNYLMQCG